MKRKLLTDQEYKARAMLIGNGWEYEESHHVFYNLMANFGPMEYRDADTLEPLSWTEAKLRQGQFRKIYPQN